MRKKIEEQLAKLAFGDMDAEEARLLELRTKSDPEAARTVNAYRQMKDELRSLSLDVPEDQLSKERLREAILTRGLERKAEPTRPTWLWMPAAAAVLAFGIVFVKGQLATGPNSAPMVVDKSTATPKIDVPRFTIVKPSVPNNMAASKSATKVVTAKEGTMVASLDSRYSRDERSNYSFDSSRGLRASEELPKGASDLDLLNVTAPSIEEKSREMAETKPFGGKSETALREGLQASANQPTIVVIQPETDSNTGTLKATEIENTANVVVGG